MERTFSGYCRSQDQSRTVFIELEDGEWDITCDYPDCAYACACTIGKQIHSLQQEVEP